MKWVGGVLGVAAVLPATAVTTTVDGKSVRTVEIGGPPNTWTALTRNGRRIGWIHTDVDGFIQETRSEPIRKIDWSKEIKFK